MKQNTVKISIGIVAYNEEKNIKNVLRDILSQERISWKLCKIYLACDGCTDRTIEFAKSIRNPNMQIIVNSQREGKPVNEQKIFNKFEDEILVMFDGDVRLEGQQVIESLVQKLIRNPDVALVGGNARPFFPKTFFEKAVYTTFMVLDKSRLFIKNGNNIYGASGQCLAIRKSLIKQIHFPKTIVAEDDFIYFTNLSNQGKFLYCKEAIVRYKLPQIISDYARQVLRADPAAAIANIKQYFGDIVFQEYKRPLIFYAVAVWESFTWNPVGSLYMISIRIISRFIVPFTSNYYSLEWFTAKTTK